MLEKYFFHCTRSETSSGNSAYRSVIPAREIQVELGRGAGGRCEDDEGEGVVPVKDN